jgi:hypothetical protein
VLGEHPYFEELHEALKRNLEPGQSITILDQIPITQMDLKPSLLKIRNHRNDFDSLGVFLWIGQVSSFYRQMKEIALTIPTFGTDVFESVSEIKASNGQLEGIHFSGLDIKQEYVDRYSQAYKNESQLSFGSAAYEFATTVGELLNQDGDKLTAEEIIGKFSTVSSKQGTASGPYNYVNDPKVGQYFRFPLAIKEIAGDGFKKIY